MHQDRNNADYVDLHSLLRSLKAKRRFIMLFTLLLTSMAIAYSSLKAPKYQASALLRIQHNQHSLISTDMNTGPNQAAMNLVEEPLSLQIPLIKSEYILKPVIEKFGLETTNTAKISETMLINQLRNNLIITDLNTQNETNNKVALIRVSLIDKNPATATKILNIILNVMQQENIRFKARATNNKLHFLEKQLAIIKTALQEAQIKLNRYQAQSGRVDTQLQTQYLLSHLAEVNKEIEKKRLEEVDALQQYTVHHPTYISLKSEQAALQKKRNQLMNQLKTLPDLDQVNASLKQDVKVKNNLYMLLLNQIYQFQVLQTGILSDIEVLSPVTKAEKIPPPRMIVIIIFSLFVGVMISSMSVLVWNILNRYKTS